MKLPLFIPACFFFCFSSKYRQLSLSVCVVLVPAVVCWCCRAGIYIHIYIPGIYMWNVVLATGGVNEEERQHVCAGSFCFASFFALFRTFSFSLFPPTSSNCNTRLLHAAEFGGGERARGNWSVAR